MSDSTNQKMTLKEYIESHKELNSSNQNPKEMKHKFQNLKMAADYFMRKYPKEISIVVSRQSPKMITHLFGKKISDKEEMVEVHYNPTYRFTFSEEGTMRELQTSGKVIKSRELFEKIKEEFLENGLLTWIGYKGENSDTDHLEIQVINSKKEKIKFHFQSSTKEEYDKLKEEFEHLKQEDFKRYCNSLIDENRVQTFSIRPAVDDRSSILYIPNNEEYYTSLFTRGKLGYYYKKEEGRIELEELVTISEIIRHFINCHLKENPRYKYKTPLDNIQNEKDLLRIKNLSETLKIYFESGIELKITDSDLIYGLEKLGLIDDLYQLQNGKISEMPESKNKILKKGEM